MSYMYRFAARKLLTLSLALTGLGGFYFATIPSQFGACVLFAYWGFTTILLFWAALIRATRDWGSDREQGRAYGILDGGRGLLAAGLASLAVLLLHFFLPDNPANATDLERLTALKGIIHAYSWTTLGAAALVWFFVPEQNKAPDKGPRFDWRNSLRVLTLPAVWLQALIVVCAYVAYKGLDNCSLFALEGYGLNEVYAAQLSAFTAWVRPLAAVGAGFLGDRIGSSRVILGGFSILFASHLFFALTTPQVSMVWILVANIVIASIAIFGLRGVYFALFEEASIPRAFTGTAVGLVSMIGYTPDIFVALVAGWLLDRSPGLAGHQHFYLFLTGFAALGMIATVLFRRHCLKENLEL